VVEIPGSADSLLLLDYWDGPKVYANLSRVREDGTHVWTAAPQPPMPTSPDAWAQIHLDGAAVIAYSWSGWLVRLDLVTGAELSREFVK